MLEPLSLEIACPDQPADPTRAEQRRPERRRAVGIPIRIVRTIALDHPLAYWLVVLQHEGFGHGGRAREFGSSADVHMGSPWQGRSSFIKRN